MSSRRHEDYSPTSDSLVRLRDFRRELDGGLSYEMTRRDDLDLDGGSCYEMTRRDDLDRTTRSRRCLSPGTQRQQFSGDGRINSLESRDYNWEFSNRGNRKEQMTSMSPEFVLVKRKPQGSEGGSRRDSQYTQTSDGYDYRGYMNEKYNNNITGSMPEYLSDTTRTIREHFSHDSKLKDFGDYRRLSEESVRRPTDILSNYGERGSNYLPSKKNSEAGYRDDSAYYPEPLPNVDKSSYSKYHEERDKSVTYSRDVSHPHVMPSKDSRGTFPYKQIAGTSSTGLRANFSGFYMDDLHSYEDEFLRDPASTTSRRSNRQAYLLDQRGDSEIKNRSMMGYQRNNASPVRHEDQGYLNTGNRNEVDGFDYPFNECRRVDSEDQVDINQDDYFLHGIKDVVRTRDGSSGHLRSDSCENPSMTKQIESFYYTDVSISKPVSEKGKEFADRRMSRYHEVVPSDIIYDRSVSPSWKSSQYRYGREIGPSSHGESMRSLDSDHNSEVRELRSNYGRRKNADSYIGRTTMSQGFKYDDEIHAHHDLSDRRLKRKYEVDEPINRDNCSSDMIWQKEEWTDEDLEIQIPSRRIYYDNSKPFQRKRGIFDRLVEREHVAHDDHLQGRSGVHSRLGTGSPGRYNSFQFSKKQKPYRPNNVWIRGKDNDKANTDYTVDDKPDKSESWVISKKPEPPEDSQEFHQLVQKAFLVFSKKLNENPSVRRIYKEQGRAGSLFCIVCGRSKSKEFMETNRLAIHAYMSHKVGLRSQHLGLLKAICVLMGWNTEATPNSEIYIPKPVSEAKALAQKEDLILWPPVMIIHSTSQVAVRGNNNNNIVDEVSEFLKGKGLVGNYKATLGKGNGVVVLKYLGTVSNLQNAERIHKYFSDNKIGRVDYKERRDGGGYCYGYMGISEDMDILDNDTKVKCVIKSKKEIHDIVDAVPIEHT